MITEIQIPPIKVYPYGKPQIKNDSQDYDKSHLVIYVSPAIFTNVPLSSLEGYFVQETGLERERDLDWYVPQIVLPRDKRDDFAKKHHGRFVPFSK